MRKELVLSANLVSSLLHTRGREGQKYHGGRSLEAESSCSQASESGFTDLVFGGFLFARVCRAIDESALR